MDVESAAEQLYAELPENFVRRRGVLVAQARAAGERDTAARIGGLRKPSVAAWLANQLARRNAADLGRLFALGGELREATAALDGSRLRELSRRRSAIVAPLVDRARQLALSLDRPASPDTLHDVEQTLLAALADPELGAALHAGRLIDRLEFVGFPAPGTAQQAARMPAGRRSSAARFPAVNTGAANAVAGGAADGEVATGETGTGKTGAGNTAAGKTAGSARRTAPARRAELERELESAWQAASTANGSHDEARTAVRGARRAEAAARQVVAQQRRAVEVARAEVEEARTRLQRTQAELGTATADLARAEAAAATATGDQDSAAAALSDARAAVGALQRHLDELSR